jgi:hypothetical protein
MVVNFYRTKRRCVPEDRTLHNHRCENPKSYNKSIKSNNSSQQIVASLTVQLLRVAAGHASLFDTYVRRQTVSGFNKFAGATSSEANRPLMMALQIEA